MEVDGETGDASGFEPEPLNLGLKPEYASSYSDEFATYAIVSFVGLNEMIRESAIGVRLSGSPTWTIAFRGVVTRLDTYAYHLQGFNSEGALIFDREVTAGASATSASEGPEDTFASALNEYCSELCYSPGLMTVVTSSVGCAVVGTGLGFVTAATGFALGLGCSIVAGIVTHNAGQSCNSQVFYCGTLILEQLVPGESSSYSEIKQVGSNPRNPDYPWSGAEFDMTIFIKIPANDNVVLNGVSYDVEAGIDMTGDDTRSYDHEWYTGGVVQYSGWYYQNREHYSSGTSELPITFAIIRIRLYVSGYMGTVQPGQCYYNVGCTTGAGVSPFPAPVAYELMECADTYRMFIGYTVYGVNTGSYHSKFVYAAAGKVYDRAQRQAFIDDFQNTSLGSVVPCYTYFNRYKQTAQWNWG